MTDREHVFLVLGFYKPLVVGISMPDNFRGFHAL